MRLHQTLPYLPNWQVLRFTNLTNLVTPVNNPDPQNGVLSVDNDGDVIFVYDQGGASIVTADNGLSINPAQNVQLGHDLTGGSGADLLDDREIPFGGHRIVFSDPASINGDDNSIGIGVTTPVAKLDIYRPVTTTNSISVPIALNVKTDDYSSSGTYTTTGHGIKSTNDGPNRDNYAGTFHSTLAYRNYGVGGHAIGFGVGGGSNVNNANTGGFFRGAYGASINTGVSGDGESASPNASATATGGYFIGRGSTNLNYGIYCTVTGTASSTDYAGYFSGDVYCTGAYLPSDTLLKENITPLTDGLFVISQIFPKSYTYKLNQYPNMNLPDNTHAGFLAEDIEQALPTLLKTAQQPAVYDTVGNIITPAISFKAINYIEIIPYLVGAIQQQQQQLYDMQMQIDNCCNQPKPANNNGNGQQQKTGAIKVELSNVSRVIQLFQNDPNPFNDQTVINYYLPESVGSAEIWFIDNNGTVIKKITISERGEGSMIVMGSNLTSGTYSYNLIADNKIIDGKKMVKVK